MFYFSRFSTHFLFTNLVVIPLVTIILYSAVVMLLLTPLHWIQNFIAEGVKFLLDALNTFIHWVEQLPYALLTEYGYISWKCSAFTSPAVWCFTISQTGD